MLVEQKQYNLTASVGIVVYPRDGDRQSTLVQRADTAMHEAKYRGKNRIHVFEIIDIVARKSVIRFRIRELSENSRHSSMKAAARRVLWTLLCRGFIVKCSSCTCAAIMLDNAQGKGVVIAPHLHADHE